MTASGSHGFYRREAYVPWLFRPRFILGANALGLVVNIAAAIAESGRYSKFDNVCATVNKPTSFGAPGMSTPVAVAVIAIFVIAGVSILVAIAWCAGKLLNRDRGGSAVAIAVFMIVFALVNLLFASYFDLRALSDVTCPGKA